jgi:hypothetical protein
MIRPDSDTPQINMFCPITIFIIEQMTKVLTLTRALGRADVIGAGTPAAYPGIII